MCLSNLPPLSGSDSVGRVKKLKSKLSMVHHAVPLGVGQPGGSHWESFRKCLAPFYLSASMLTALVPQASWQMRAEVIAGFLAGCSPRTWIVLLSWWKPVTRVSAFVYGFVCLSSGSISIFKYYSHCEHTLLLGKQTASVEFCCMMQEAQPGARVGDWPETAGWGGREVGSEEGGNFISLRADSRWCVQNQRKTKQLIHKF